MDIIKLVTQKDFYISNRKEFISCDLNPSWRISLLLLVVHLVGRGNKSSRNKVHLVNWALKDTKHEKSFLNYVAQQDSRPFINLDPAMDKAIDFALYSKLISISKNRIQLTEGGVAIANRLLKEDVFLVEKSAMMRMKKALTETNVTNSFEGKL